MMSAVTFERSFQKKKTLEDKKAANTFSFEG
jgi:hypothetical protein